MKVLLIGKTQVDLFPFNGTSRHVMPGKAEGSEFEKRVRGERSRGSIAIAKGQDLIEFAGRLCYESFNLPNKKTADNSGYVQNIVRLKHESVLEHVSVTFYVEGVSRNLSHELIRHRHLSFSELSQRYVDMEDANVVFPPAFQAEAEIAPTQPLGASHKAAYREAVDFLTGIGYGRKQAREAARYGLPAGTETKFVVTGNLRAWRDVLKKRWSKHADAEMQEFAGFVAGILLEQYPDVFDDIAKEED